MYVCECDWNHHLTFMHKMWCACVTARIMKKEASWVEKKNSSRPLLANA